MKLRPETCYRYTLGLGCCINLHYLDGVVMRTTLDIDDALLIKAKSLAAKEHTSLTRLIEQGLMLRLRSQSTSANGHRPALPVYAGKGGLQPTVAEALSHRALLDAADDAP